MSGNCYHKYNITNLIVTTVDIDLVVLNDAPREKLMVHFRWSCDRTISKSLNRLKFWTFFFFKSICLPGAMFRAQILSPLTSNKEK